MKSNPDISELMQGDQYELIAELGHKEIKEFVMQQIVNGTKLLSVFNVYQVLMLIGGVIIFGIAGTKAFYGDFQYLKAVTYSLIFSFTLLIIIHEILHGIALKILGAPRIKYGGNLKRFIFYAEADRFVMNQKQYAFVALAPFVIIKIVSIAGVILFWGSPVLWFFIMLMSIHSLFCAGDFGLISFMSKAGQNVYTFDKTDEKKSYYFRKKKD